MSGYRGKHSILPTPKSNSLHKHYTLAWMTPSSGLQVVSGSQNDPVSLFFFSSQTKASIRDNVHPNHYAAMTFNSTINKIWQKKNHCPIKTIIRNILKITQVPHSPKQPGTVKGGQTGFTGLLPCSCMKWFLRSLYREQSPHVVDVWKQKELPGRELSSWIVWAGVRKAYLMRPVWCWTSYCMSAWVSKTPPAS